MKNVTSKVIKLSSRDIKKGVVLLAKETYDKVVREKQTPLIYNLKKIIIASK